MKNFKPGMKVVFKCTGFFNSECNKPKENEIVTIKAKCDMVPDYWDIFEYPTSKDGRPQSFHERDLFPPRRTRNIVNDAPGRIKSAKA